MFFHVPEIAFLASSLHPDPLTWNRRKLDSHHPRAGRACRESGLQTGAAQWQEMFPAAQRASRICSEATGGTLPAAYVGWDRQRFISSSTSATARREQTRLGAGWAGDEKRLTVSEVTARIPLGFLGLWLVFLDFSSVFNKE